MYCVVLMCCSVHSRVIDVCACSILVLLLILFFFFKQKTAYEMRISDWSSDVCSSDLLHGRQWFGFALVSAGVLLSAWVPARWRGNATEPLRGAVLGAASIALMALAIVMIKRVLETRSEERRVGKECVSTCSTRWAPCQ